MSHLNIEIKARCNFLETARQILQQHQAVAHGNHLQIDTYFNCPHGKLKLRQSDDWTGLIHYQREHKAGPKQSLITFYYPQDANSLKTVLSKAYGILVEVEKQREIYFIENIKFHLDQVKGLGLFLEIEAIDFEGTIGQEKLYSQCETWLTILNIKPEDLISNSYSDLLLSK